MPISKVINNFYQKYVPNDLQRIKTSVNYATTYGWKAGKRCARINNKNFATDMYSRGKSMIRNLKLSKEDMMPAAGFILGTALIPIIGGAIIGYFIGKGAKSILKLITKARF